MQQAWNTLSAILAPTELPLMDVLPDHPEFKYILTLQEGVAMAMADGYALASGKAGRVECARGSRPGKCHGHAV
jgi:benzoylformate decarboxylase